MKRILVMVSGGLKSLATVALATKEVQEEGGKVALIHLDYGQYNSKQEQLAVQVCSQHFKVPYEIYPAHVLGADWKLFKWTTSILTVCKFANERQFTHVYAGTGRDAIDARRESTMTQLDAVHMFLDNMQPYHDEDGFVQPKLSFEEPFLKLTAPQLVYYCKDWNLPWSYSWSCPTPHNGSHCGTCTHCLRRFGGLTTGGNRDYTVYFRDPTIANLLRYQTKCHTTTTTCT